MYSIICPSVGDLKGDRIEYCRHKTGRQITVRIPQQALALFQAYHDKDQDSIYLFPILHSGPKDDGKLYRYYLYLLSLFNKRLRKIAMLLLPGVMLSSYTPQHTWATLASYHSTPVGMISKALGHSSIKVT